MIQRLQTAGRQLNRTEPLVVGALALGTIAGDWLLGPAVLVALLYWPLRMAALGRLGRRTPIDAALVALLPLLPLTLWASTQPTATIVQVLRLLLGMLLLAALVNGLGQLPRAATRLAYGVLLLTAAGLALLLLSVPAENVPQLPPLPQLPQLPQLPVGSVNANVLGGALALLAPLPLGLALFGWRSLVRIERLGVVLALLLVLPALLLTRSRGGLLALAIVAVGLLVLRWRRLAWVGALALLGLIALVWRSGATALLDALTVSAAGGGLAERLAIWQRALLMLRDFPFTGIGMGQFGPLADTVYPFEQIAPGIIPHAHNLLLQVAVDLGIVGLIVWLTVWLGVVGAGVAVWRQARAARDRWLSGACAGLLGSQAVLLLHGLVDAPLWGTRPAVLVWATWGLLLALATGAAAKTKSTATGAVPVEKSS